MCALESPREGEPCFVPPARPTPSGVSRWVGKRSPESRENRRMWLGLDQGYEAASRFSRTRSGASGEIRPTEAACSAAAAESATATIVVPIPSTSAAI